jgi:signal transduction histidine kinase
VKRETWVRASRITHHESRITHHASRITHHASIFELRKSSASITMNYHKLFFFIFGILFLSGLYVSSLYSFLLFHALAEMFSIAVAWGIFFITWNTRKMMENDYLLFMGIAYLFIGFMDMLHTLAYKGMGVFPGYGANLPTQLWIAARWMESLCFLCAVLFIRRRFSTDSLFEILTVITAGLTVLIFTGVFPDCFLEESGLTLFKKTSEILISSILLISAYLIWNRRNIYDISVLKMILFSVFLTIGSEMCFIFYISVYDYSNLMGHYLKIFSFYFIYKAIIQTGLSNPVGFLFQEVHYQKSQLQKAQEELEQRVRERTYELERSNRELEDFAHIVSHDLREPLRGIHNFSNFLLEDYSEKIDDAGQTMLKTLSRLTKRLEDQIAAILHYSRIGRINLSMQETDLNAVVHDVLDSLKFSLDENHAAVQIRGPLPRIRCDRIRITEVFCNLVTNAIKYNDRPEKQIEIGVLENNKTVPVFYVKDDGIGIRQKHLEKIFKMFKRLHQKKAYGGGTGAGLAIVKKIIERHNGDLWAESCIGKGTTFYFTLQKGDYGHAEEPADSGH